MAQLFGIELVPASVPVGSPFLDAAAVLTAFPVSTIAVLDRDGRVAGLFGGDHLLAGLFPAYLKELRHTAFVTDDELLLERRAREVAGEPVEKHMVEPVVVDAGTSATHVAELFLHCEEDALPVVEDGRFLGMLGRSEFCRVMLRRTERR